jgi:hypothetical protein
VGSRLDAEEVELGTLEVQPTAVALRVLGRMREDHLDADALQQESVARQALRGHVPGPRAAAPERYETRLRVLGTMLEAEPPQAYTIVVAPQLVGVEGSAGYFRLLSVSELAARAGAGQLQRRIRDRGDG